MYFGKLVDSLGFRFKDLDVSTSNPSGRDIAKYYINQSTKWLYRTSQTEQRRQIGEFVQIPNYTTGTCSVTKYDGTNESAAKQVTFSAALPSGFQGRYLQVQNESDWHRILYISGSIAYLESPILISTASSLTFKIWKRFYYMPSNVDVITRIGKYDGSGKIEFSDDALLQDMVIDITQEGSPTRFVPFGDDPFFVPYTTGTISVPIDSNVVTGVGSSWAGNVFPGDIFTVNLIDYRVKRVETDTRIILHNFINPAVAASTAHSVTKDISLGLQLFPNENNYRIIPYVFFDKHFNMIHETLGKPNLPDAWDEAILTRAEMMILKDKRDSGWISVSQLLDSQVAELKRRKRVVQTRYDQFAPKIFSGMPGRNV